MLSYPLSHSLKTDRLLQAFGVLRAINAVKDCESAYYESLVKEYESLVLLIQQDHVSAAKSHVKNEIIQSSLINEIEAECRELIDYRVAAERWKLEMDSRSKDRIISVGEKLSCRFVTSLLQDRVSLLSAAAVGFRSR
jgi:aspartate kinase